MSALSNANTIFFNGKNKELQENNQDKLVAKNVERRLLSMWLFRILTALAFAFVISVIFLFLSIYMPAEWYNNHHAIPNPVERGDDLGLPIFGFSWGFLAFLVSYPVFFVLFYKSIKKYLKDN